MSFIFDLSLILLVAGLAQIVFAGNTHIPIFLRYLLAGAVVKEIVEPWLPLTSFEHLHTWSEIGIIFLLFSIGLEFSIKDFFHLGTTPIKVGLFETLGTQAIIMSLLQASPLRFSNTLAMALTFTISSTAIIAKSFNESEHKKRKFVTHALSILVFEDIAVIFILLILPALAASQNLSGWALLEKLLLIVSFIFVSVVLGLIALPRLEKILKHLKNEAMLIFTLGFALFFSSLSQLTGLSHGLGAFLAGSLLASLPKHKELVQLTSPIKNLFLAIFFVSTGMLFKWPKAHALLPALGLTLVVMLTKFFVVSFGLLLNREKLGTSIKTGLAMTAMGEFSILIANRVLELNLISETLFQVLILSIFLNIILYTFLLPRFTLISEKILAKIPKRLYELIDQYRSPSAAIHKGPLTFFSQYYLKNFLLHTLIILSVTLLSKKLLLLFGHTPWERRLIILISLIISLPFFWAMVFYRPKMKEDVAKNFMEKLPVYQNLIFLLRIGLALFIFLATGGYLLGSKDTVILLLASGVALWVLRKELAIIYSKIEKSFFDEAFQLSSRDVVEASALSQNISPQRPPSNINESWRKNSIWDAEMLELKLPDSSPWVGHSLGELAWGEKFGVLLAAISRHGKRILGPSRFERLFPGDILYLIGSEEDLNNFLDHFHKEAGSASNTDEVSPQDLSLESYDIPQGSPLINQSIRQSNLRNEGGSLVIGIERKGERVFIPDPNFPLKEGDRVWLAGDKAAIRQKIRLLEEDHQKSLQQSIDPYMEEHKEKP